MAAGDVVVIGAATFTQTGQRDEYVKGQGWYIVKTYEGPESAKDAAVQSHVDAGAEVVTATKGNPATIEAKYQNLFGGTTPDTPTAPIDESEWTLSWSDLSKDLATHGIFNQSVNYPEYVATIEADIKAGIATDGATPPTVKNYDSLMGAGMTAYARLRMQGVTSFLAFAPTLRQTIVMPANHSSIDIINASQRDQGKIVTWANIDNGKGSGVPQSTGIAQPWALVYWGSGDGFGTVPPIRGTSSSVPGWIEAYFDAWMVRPPDVGWRRSGKVKKREITRHWIGAFAWSSTLYNGGTGVP